MRRMPVPTRSTLRALNRRSAMSGLRWTLLVPKSAGAEARRQAAGIDDRDAVREDLHEDVAAADRVIAVHKGVDHALAQGFHREFRMLDAVEAADLVAHRQVLQEEYLRLLEVVEQAAVEVFAVEYARTLRGLEEDAGHSGLGQEARGLLGEERCWDRRAGSSRPRSHEACVCPPGLRSRGGHGLGI